MANFIINIPPMPKPEDFGIEWEADTKDLEEHRKQERWGYQGTPDHPALVEIRAKGASAQAKIDAYNKALEIWKEVVSQIAATLSSKS